MLLYYMDNKSANHKKRSFLVVVLSAYSQMRAQKSPILADIDEDNFDRAFDHFRSSELLRAR